MSAATNTPPTITAPTNYTAFEDVILPITGITVADSDAGTNALEFTITVSSGTLSSTAWSGIGFTQTNSGSLSITGSVAALNSYLGTNAVTFLSETNSTNLVVLGITMNDLGYSNGPPEIRTEFVPIVITPVVDPPLQTVPGHAFTNIVATITGFGTNEGRFRSPGPGAVDSSGNLHVVDQRRKVINRYSARGEYLATFGTPGTNSGELSQVYAIGIDHESRVYVGDNERQRVLIYGTNGVFHEEWGVSGTNDNQIQGIGGLAFDSANQLYLLDYLASQVKKFTTNGTFIAAWGSNGTANSTFLYPRSLAVSPDDGVLVTEYTLGVIQIFETNGSPRSTIGSPVSTNGQFFAPNGLAVDSTGAIFVSDGENRIYRLDANGNLLAAWGSNGTEPGQFFGAPDLVTDPDGNLYTIEFVPSRIQKFSPASYLTRPDEPIALTGLNVTGVDGTIVSSELSVTNGLLTLDLGGGAWTASAATNVTSLVVTGSTAQINAALATALYSPAPNSTGFDALTWISTDNAGTTATNHIRLAHHQNLPLHNLVPTNTPTTSIIEPLQLTNVFGVIDPDAGTNLIRVTLKTGYRDFTEFNSSLTNDINDSPRGTFSLATITDLTFTTGTGTNDNHLVFTGTLTAISNALSVVTYSPSPFLVGEDLAQMIAEDISAHCCGLQRDADLFAIQITNSLPRVTRVEAVDPDGIYGIGSNLIFHVYFDQFIVAAYNGTNPYVRLMLDSGTVTAPLFGQNTNMAMFVYTVREGDTSAGVDYDGTNALVAGDDSFIRNLIGNNANLTLPPPGSSNSLAGSAIWTIDGVSPSWSSLSLPTNGVYHPGDILEFVLEAPEPIYFATNSSGPRLGLVIGTNETHATFFSGNGYHQLTFRYTVQPNDLAPVGIVVNPTLDLNGTVLTDYANNAVSTNLPSIGSTTNILIASQPFVTLVRARNAGNHYGIGSSITIEVQFNQIVVAGYDGTNPYVRLRLDSGTATAPLVFQNTNFALFDYTIREGDVAALLDYDGTNALVVSDGSFLRGLGGFPADLTLPPPGSSNSIAGQDTFIIDGIRPVWTNVVLPTNGLYKVGEVLNFVLEASETLYLDTNSVLPRLTLTLGTSNVFAGFVSALQSNRLHFAYTLQSGDQAMDGITLNTTLDFNGSPIYDRASNFITNALPPFGSTTGITVDANPPRLSYGVLFDPPAGPQGVGSVLHFGVSVSKPVTVDTNLGLPALELHLASGTVFPTYVSNFYQALQFTYTVQAGDSAPTNTAYLGDTLHLNGATIRDALNYNLNTSLLHTSALPFLEIDGLLPSLTNANPPSDGLYGFGQHLDFTLEFDEPVTNSGNPKVELTIGSTTRFATYHSGSGSSAIIFRYTIQSGDLDLNGISALDSLNLTDGTLRDLAANAIEPAAGSPIAFAGIVVNSASPGANHDSYSVNEDQSLNGASVLGNDSQVGTNTLIALLITNVAHGTLTLETNGTFQYRPATNFAGIDSFTYAATDGMQTSGVATVTLSVHAINDPPTLSVPLILTVTGGVATVVSEITFTDADAGTNAVHVFLIASDPGSLLTATNLGGVVASNAAAHELHLWGSVADLNAAIASSNVVYTPPTGYPNFLPLFVRIEDLGNTGADPGIDADPEGEGNHAPILVDNGAVNDPPFIVNAITNQDGVYGAAFTFTFPTNVFVDFDGDPIRLSATGFPSGITFQAETRTFSGTPTAVGEFPIELIAGDNQSPELFATNTFILTIAKATLTATADDQTRIRGAQNPPLTITYSGFVGADDESGLDVLPTAETSANAASPAGEYTIMLSGGSDDHYSFTRADGSLTITNPVALGNVRGTYHGLFYETNEVRHQSSGAFLIKASDSGAYSGTLQLAGQTLRVSGAFNPQRVVTNSISRKNLPALTVELAFDHQQPPRALYGRLTDGTWTAPLFGTPLDFNASTNPAPTAGRYTMVFPGTDDHFTVPGGDGYGVVSVDAAGKLKLTGALPDGTKLSHASVVNTAALWPFYLALYKKSGSAIGWLSFTNEPDAAPSGLVSWIKPTQTSGAMYRPGFTNELSATGSRYLPPGKGTNMLSWTNGTLLATAGNLPASLSNTFVIGASHRVTLAPGSVTKLKLNSKDGRFSGSLRHTATGKSTSFNGVVLQSLEEGFGFFLGTNQSGRVTLTP